MNHYSNQELSKIKTYLKSFEEKYDIEIISAIDCGSRAKGLDSEKSDYDIRFIYIHNRRIKHIYGKMQSIHETLENEMYDFDGWSIDKTIQLLKESNPTLIEWLHSQIIIINKYDFIHDCLKIANKMHNKLSMFYHYSSMATKNYKLWIENKDQVIYKKYIYIIFPLLMVKYLSQSKNEKLVILNFMELINKVNLDTNVHNIIQKIITIKKNHKILTGPPFKELESWINHELFEIDQLKERKSKKKGDNMTGRSIISKYTKMSNEVMTMNKIINGIQEVKGLHKKINKKIMIRVLFSALEFLWVWNNQDKNVNQIPNSSMNLLLANSDLLPTSIESTIHDIINYNKIDQLNEELLQKVKDYTKECLKIYLNFVDPSETTYKIKQIQSLVDNRHDIHKYLFESVLGVVWLSNQKQNKNIRDIPKNVLSDKIGLGHILQEKVVNFLRELTPLYMIDIIPELNTWLNDIVQNYEILVTQYKQNLLKIKEINVHERYCNSIKKIDENTFIQIVENILFKNPLYSEKDGEK